MKRLTVLISSLATFLLMATTASAQTQPNERDSQPPTGPMVLVENIEFLGQSGGEDNVEIAGFNFFPVGSAGAHLDLATGKIEEEIGDPATTDGLWWDVDFKVTVSPNDVNPTTGLPRQPVMLAIDKDVRNFTRWHWTDFHMTLGMRTATGEFMESDEFDFLYFKDEPPAMETTGWFDHPPMKDEPVAPDSLWWMGGTGVKPGDVAVFWLGIQIPPDKFMPSTAGLPPMATFVLREHASIPEPATLALLAFAGGLVLGGRFRRV